MQTPKMFPGSKFPIMDAPQTYLQNISHVVIEKSPDVLASPNKPNLDLTLDFVSFSLQAWSAGGQNKLKKCLP